MSFLEKLKSAFRSKPPAYKLYNHTELKMIAMKCRIYIEEYYKKCIQSIQASDSILLQRKQSPGDCYRILQEIGRHVIEAQTLKIYNEILRKIQDKSPLIIKTNGDIALLKAQLNWFQCLLWYKKCKKLIGLQQLHTFCYNFFKGVDITFQITPKCQIFQIYPIMLFLDPDCIIPLKKVYPQIQQYLKTELNEEIKKQIFKLNKEDIKEWVKKQRIEHHHQFLSKSKSKSPVRPHFTPKKYQNGQENWKNSSASNIEFPKKTDDNKWVNNNNNKTFDDSKKDKDKSTEPVKQDTKSSSVSTSFYRKVMQTSKVKEKEYYNCEFCGKISQREKTEDVGGFQKYCQTCWQNMNKKPQSNKIQMTDQKNEYKTCKICNKLIFNYQNDLSFNNSKVELKPNTNSFSFSDESLCESCQRQLQNNSNNKQIDKFIDEIFPNDPNMNNPGLDQAKKGEIQQNAVVSFDDEEDSLKFIRQTIVQKKKPIKKPYMVSIYGRAQYVQLKKNQ